MHNPTEKSILTWIENNCFETQNKLENGIKDVCHIYRAIRDGICELENRGFQKTHTSVNASGSVVEHWTRTPKSHG